MIAVKEHFIRDSAAKREPMAARSHSPARTRTRAPRYTLNEAGVWRHVRSVLEQHPDNFHDAHLVFDGRQGYELRFHVPNYSGSLDSATLNSIQRQLGALYTVRVESNPRSLNIVAEEPSSNVLRHVDRIRGSFLAKLQATRLSPIAAALLVCTAAALTILFGSALYWHWSGFDRPWDSLFGRAKHAWGFS